MSPEQCPGQDSRFLKPEQIAVANCGKCGQKVEFWPDEIARRCPECGKRVANPKADLGCLEWCEYAEQCLGRLKESGLDPENARDFAIGNAPEDAQPDE